MLVPHSVTMLAYLLELGWIFLEGKLAQELELLLEKNLGMTLVLK